MMFFPEGKGEPFTLRIHRRTLRLVTASLVLFIFGIAVLLFKAGDIALRLQLVHMLKEENKSLRRHNENLQISSEKIVRIDSLTAYLHRLANTPQLNEAPAVNVPRNVVSAGPSRFVEEIKSRRDEEKTVQKNVLINNELYAASVPSILPVNGWITKHFSIDTSDAHLATDFAAAAGTPIRATAMGVVEDVRNDRYLGLIVEIRHEFGFVTRYGHCSQVLVSPRDKVNRGQTVALVGNTGRSTAPHLHYEILKDGKPVNPMDYVTAHKH